MYNSETQPSCSSASDGIRTSVMPPVMLQLTRRKTLRLCQCVALPHSGGNVPENGVALGLSEPSCKVLNAGNEPLLPQEGGSVPVRGTSLMTRTDRFGKAPGCAHVWGTVPANTTQCIGAKSALRLNAALWAGARDATGELQTRSKCLSFNMHRHMQPEIQMLLYKQTSQQASQQALLSNKSPLQIMYC